MSAISSVAFACIFGGTLLGMFVRTILPVHHVSNESKDAVKLGTGMIATMAALVLALLIASAKGNFDTMSSGLRQTASGSYCSTASWPNMGRRQKKPASCCATASTPRSSGYGRKTRAGKRLLSPLGGRAPIEVIQDQLRQLSTWNDAPRWLQSRALQISGDIAEGRWLLIEQSGQRSIPMPFFVMLVFWLTVIFASFGLFSPRNATVIVVLLICALSAAGSLFLILELDTPYEGLIKVSSAPLRNALAHLGQ